MFPLCPPMALPVRSEMLPPLPLLVVPVDSVMLPLDARASLVLTAMLPLS